jgi:hypothetical protein
MTEWFADREEDFAESVEGILELATWAAGIPREGSAPGQPQWENDYWGTLDALMQCASLRRRDPSLYLEIGSGWSTLFARRAIEDFGLRTRIVSIDPEPRADVDEQADEIVRQPLEEIDLAIFDQLRPGDMVLLDGSHTALMNSDAVVFLLEVMPRLAPSVLVGIDDIYLPRDYHPTWTGRVYGEQYLLAAFLLGGAQGWTVRFPGLWATTDSKWSGRFEAIWPTVANRFERVATSLWLERGS